MSNQAITWATQQRTGRSVVKFLLVAIANYCDDQGKCWPKQKTLAEDTEMSLDSIQRHLRELERLGFLYRTPRRHEGGQRAADYMILLLSDDARFFAAAHGWSPHSEDSHVQENGPDEEDEDETIAADCGHGISENHSRNQPEPKPQLCGSYTDEPSKNPNNPLPPSADLPKGSGPTEDRAPKVQASTTEIRSWEADADEFERLWPFERTDAKDPCRRSLRSTAPEVRAKILSAVPRYLADIRARNAKRCSPKRFLRDKVWQGFIDGAAPKAVNRVFVRYGSDAWNAWQATRPLSWPVTDHRDEQGRLVRGWWFPTLFPPPATAREGPAAA